MGAFDSFFVVDAHARYQFINAVSAEIGVDNLTNANISCSTRSPAGPSSPA